MRLVRRMRESKPHVKVGVVTFVLILSGVAVLLVSLHSLDQIDGHVTVMQRQVQPARDELLRLEQGLTRLQSTFVTVMSEPDRLKRVLLIEEIRKQLSVNEEAWRRFKAASLQQPGEGELIARFDDLSAQFARLEPGVALYLLGEGDPTTLWREQVFIDIRQVQEDTIATVIELDERFYAPLAIPEVNGAADAASSAHRDILLAFAGVMALSIPLALASFSSARRTEAERQADNERRAEEARRSLLEAQLNRAFEMSSSESAAYAIVGQALRDNLPGRPAELLMADSSVAHFRQVLSTAADGHGPGCGVVAPSDCPAAHRGDTLVFARSDALDSCPYLRERSGEPCAAVCQPVSIAGKAIGVIHTTLEVGQAPASRMLVDLDLVARRAGERIGMLRAFAESESQAKTDPLTGMLNRRSLENSTRRLVHDGIGYCVAYGDLDHFKRLNDAHGHDVGDRALRSFSKVLRDAIRPNDLACRYGGEEFVLVLPECGVDEAVTVVERVRAGLADALVGGRLPPFTVSFGVASSRQADSFERVVALADEALLRAKATGRDRVLVSGQGPPELARPTVVELNP